MRAFLTAAVGVLTAVTIASSQPLPKSGCATIAKATETVALAMEQFTAEAASLDMSPLQARASGDAAAAVEQFEAQRKRFVPVARDFTGAARELSRKMQACAR